jgi:hypothetical protein
MNHNEERRGIVMRGVLVIFAIVLIPRSGRGDGGFGIFSPNRFHDQTGLDGLGANLDADYRAVDDSANFLDIRLKFASGYTGDFGADPAQILRLAAMGDLIPEGGLLTGKIANAWHTQPLKVRFQNSSRVI